MCWWFASNYDMLLAFYTKGIEEMHLVWMHFGWKMLKISLDQQVN